MSNEVIAQPAAFKAMQTDIQVSMDDVVSAFVSQYENNLYARKAELSKQIRAIEKDLEENEKDLRAAVNGDEWKGETLPFGLTYEVKQGAVNWKDKVVNFSISVKEKSSPERWGTTITVNKSKAIPAKFIKVKDAAEDELNTLRAELSEVLVNLKSVTRKERQVRGRIAMRKLEDSGYASLMQDAELIKLVQIDEE